MPDKAVKASEGPGDATKLEERIRELRALLKEEASAGITACGSFLSGLRDGEPIFISYQPIFFGRLFNADELAQGLKKGGFRTITYVGAYSGHLQIGHELLIVSLNHDTPPELGGISCITNLEKIMSEANGYMKEYQSGWSATSPRFPMPREQALLLGFTNSYSHETGKPIDQIILGSELIGSERIVDFGYVRMESASGKCLSGSAAVKG